jgi:hypothetical protein
MILPHARSVMLQAMDRAFAFRQRSIGHCMAL